MSPRRERASHLPPILHAAKVGKSGALTDQGRGGFASTTRQGLGCARAAPAPIGSVEACCEVVLPCARRRCCRRGRTLSEAIAAKPRRESARSPGTCFIGGGGWQGTHACHVCLGELLE